jgi:hypothetical protein
MIGPKNPGDPPSLVGAARPRRGARASLAGALAILAVTAAAARPAWAEHTRDECQLCHRETQMLSGAEAIPVPFVDERVLDASEHASLTCTECHENANNEVPHDSGTRDVTCDGCHELEALDHAQSVHRESLTLPESDAPGCVACHGGHDISDITSPTSKVYPLNVAATCVRCHENQALVNKHGIAQSDPNQQFSKGVHGVGLLRDGLLVSATCNDCHGSHLILPHEDARSKIAKANVADTCGTCHRGLEQVYAKSVHGLGRGGEAARDVPVCTDCHGMHDIEDPNAPGFHARGYMICARCHGDAQRMARYNLRADVVTTYLDDFHGRSNRLYAAGAGTPTRPIATCTDCHGVHDIQPLGRSGSPAVIRERVLARCQRCHDPVPAAFADAWLSHYPPSLTAAPLVWAVKWGYRFLIPLIMGGLLLHIFLNLWKLRGHLGARVASILGLRTSSRRRADPHPPIQPVEEARTQPGKSEA